ncbi:MAG: helix-turn-helix transcriptional regulator [Salinarimonas sp.]
MTRTTYPYEPDYVVSPGEVLSEHMDALGLTADDLSRRSGIASADIEALVAARAPVEAETARRLEETLGVDAGIWLGLEARWRAREPSSPEADEAGAGRRERSGLR